MYLFYGILKIHDFDPYALSLFQSYVNLSFIFLAIVIEIFSYNLVSRWRYKGIVISFVIYAILSYYVLQYAGL